MLYGLLLTLPDLLYWPSSRHLMCCYSPLNRASLMIINHLNYFIKHMKAWNLYLLVHKGEQITSYPDIFLHISGVGLVPPAHILYWWHKGFFLLQQQERIKTEQSTMKFCSIKFYLHRSKSQQQSPHGALYCKVDPTITHT